MTRSDYPTSAPLASRSRHATPICYELSVNQVLFGAASKMTSSKEADRRRRLLGARAHAGFVDAGVAVCRCLGGCHQRLDYGLRAGLYFIGRFCWQKDW
jgi:hypothetical protein